MQDDTHFIPDSGIVAYGRLSREEMKERGLTMDEKIAIRRDILKTIAKAHGITLQDTQIFFEVESGGNLTERPQILDILERCRRREVHTVIVQDIKRITRDVADWKTVATAFYKGEVLLIHGNSAEKFDRYHNDVMLKLMALLGEDERRQSSFRRKATNEQRARSGRLSQGHAPYGYHWDTERRLFFVEPSEYPVLVELFERIWFEGCYTIAQDFNRRGIPTRDKRPDASPLWLKGSLGNLIRNPFYTGHTVKRRDVDREGTPIALPESQWIWSEEPVQTVDDAGNLTPLPHPISREEWTAIQEVMASRRNGLPTKGLVSGLLRCQQGNPMHKHLHTYQCTCPPHTHVGRDVNMMGIETAVWNAVREEIAGMKLKPARRPSKPETAPRLDIERAATSRDLREKRATMDELIRRASFYHALPGYGIERHAQALQELGRDVERLEARLVTLEAQKSREEMHRAAPMLQQLAAEGGLDAFLARADAAAQRMLLRLLIARIDLHAPERVMTKRLTVTFHPFRLETQTTREASIAHGSQGKKRGPYLRRKKEQGAD